ncbi:hypothetical protein HD593_006076 [Nonomuraea rubra]|uniref:Uncharacterized protein n=1 Tax=Nonomuraea rubra TaxID=46180 RepID=A0A7X0U142_9ACTN|nr:hypothetical protein [Nonomuraea rubra]MBB6551281.1 hypothetical protein [Nonomuraea rubra]
MGWTSERGKIAMVRPSLQHFGCVRDLGPLPGLRCSRPAHAFPARQGFLGEVGESDLRARGEPVVRRQDRDTSFDDQGFMVQPGQVVERRVQQGDVGAAVADVIGAVGGSAEQDVHLARVGPAGVGGQDAGQEVRITARLDHQAQVSLLIAATRTRRSGSTTSRWHERHRVRRRGDDAAGSAVSEVGVPPDDRPRSFGELLLR